MPDNNSSVQLGTPGGRGVLFATVLGSGIVFLDSLVLNVALPTMDQDIGLGVSGLQWSVSAYLLTLSAFLLLGGSLGDLFGRRRIYITGMVLFAASSVVCGLAWDATSFVIARAVQGLGGALMIPATLAIIQSVFVAKDRGAAVGAWTGLGATFTALGPFVGGLFVTYVSWRVAFFINVPLVALAVWASLRFIPENRNECSVDRRPDYLGATLIAIGLAGLTYWSIEGPADQNGLVPLLVGLVGIAFSVLFVVSQRRSSHPMMPLSLFANPQFNWVNLCTVLFYGAFVTGVTFLGIRLQVDLNYSPLLAGVAMLPVNFMILAFSKYWGAFAQRHGAKLPMAAASLIVAIALAWMSQISDGRGYWTFVLPAIVMWGIGLSMMVAPLTAAAMASADQSHIGVASAFNNAASRVGPSFAIALVPVLAGMGGGGSLGGEKFSDGYAMAMIICAVICAIPAVIALARVDAATPATSAKR